MKFYKPLKPSEMNVYGITEAMEAMRLPKGTEGDSFYAFEGDYIIGPKDADLAKRLIRAGNDHAKAMRGIVAYIKLESLQVGFMIELETYRIGIECLSTSSAMHGELKLLSGPELAEQKQADLCTKTYTRILTASYQALRSIYRSRRKHRHPDWRIFCAFIEELPYFDDLIFPEAGK